MNRLKFFLSLNQLQQNGGFSALLHIVNSPTARSLSRKFYIDCCNKGNGVTNSKVYFPVNRYVSFDVEKTV